MSTPRITLRVENAGTFASTVIASFPVKGIRVAGPAAPRASESPRTTTTSNAPSVKFRATVEMVELTSSLRFSTGTATTPGGKLSSTTDRRSAAA